MSKHTALMLVTGQSQPGIEEALKETLSPFAIKILDVQYMDIRDRYFLAILFSLDQAHASAIEKDCMETAQKFQLDIAFDYRTEN